jgi:hypothetical protein
MCAFFCIFVYKLDAMALKISNNFTITSEIYSPTKYQFVDILEGMCKERGLSYKIESKPKPQSFWQRLIDGEKEIIAFSITGEEYSVKDLKFALELIFKNHNK